ncbi:biopolymer transporter ExbB [Cognatiyoonia koreensis]|nr:biopolymer transporter ExbB [Cognatiyoonia koreensis]
MLVVLAVVGALVYLGFAQIQAIFLSNAYLNGVILVVFVLGVLSTFGQVFQLMKSVQWIEGFAGARIGANLVEAPSLLAPLATLLNSLGSRMQISSTSSRSIQDSVAQRIDEDREITRYIGNVLIFLGLLGTFYGLATTVPALVETIRSLSPEDGESGAAVFGRLQKGLESQLGGMGTAFSSSLLGLAGSLVVGLLELFAGHGQNRFYRELEEWLSTITRLGFAGSEDGSGADTSVLGAFAQHMAEQMDALQANAILADESRLTLERQLGDMSVAIDKMVQAISLSGSSAESLDRVAKGQEALIKHLEEGGGEGLDAESRMRLRSIDVQLLRVLEELSAGRQETLAELRGDINALKMVMRHRGRPDGG